MTEAGLRCDNLTLCYRRVPVVHHLDVSMPDGQLVGVVGPNGGGKSTLLAGMVGQMPWTTGRVLLHGEDIRKQRHRLALLPQRRQHELVFPTDVGGVVAQGRVRQRGLFRSYNEADACAIDAAISSMGLQDLVDRPLGKLSGGQQQRALIARTLATGAEVLLLDEPLAALDPAACQDLLERLREWCQPGRMVVLVLHDLALAESCCDHLVVLDKELISAGPAAEVMTEERTTTCFRLRGPRTDTNAALEPKQ